MPIGLANQLYNPENPKNGEGVGIRAKKRPRRIRRGL